MQIYTCVRCSHFDGCESCVKNGREKKISEIDECNSYDEKGRVIKKESE